MAQERAAREAHCQRSHSNTEVGGPQEPERQGWVLLTRCLLFCSSARLLGICLCLPRENNNSLLLRNLPKCPLPTLTSPSFPSQRPNFYKRDSTKVTVSSTLIVIQPTIGPHFGFDFQITRPCNYKK